MTEAEAQQKFRRACALLREISAHPPFELYVASNTLCLMRGPSHLGLGAPQKQNVIDMDDGGINISGGDW